ncbi:MAG: YchJ family metal-binding protein [Gammaproteobacteria bacterium]|nr:YchJ family metal-binding protein [Gammaproteobacteria bacterium]
MLCPCSSGVEYQHCCGAYIDGKALPEYAEQLMRSRYTAYVLGKADYLAQTWHRDYRPVDLEPDPALQWIGLEILHSEEAAATATVEFEARLLAHGKVDALHENSRFVREQGQWWYTDGDMLAASFQAWKPGRNERCPCGSGKKYKRCCGA